MAYQLPQSIDAERALLGSMLLYPESVRKVADAGLTENDFFVEANRRVFTTIMDIDEEHKPVEVTGVVTRLNDKGLLNQVGGMEYLMSLADVATAPVNTSHYIELVYNKSLLRKMVDLASNLNDSAMNSTYDSIDDFFDDAEKKIHELTGKRRTTEFRTSKEVLTEVFQSIQRMKNTVGMTGVPSEFEALDNVTNGFQKGDLIILAARPSMGKTAFALNLCLNAIKDKKAQRTIAIFSLEMPAVQLVNRLLSAKGQVDGYKIRTGKLNNEELYRLMDVGKDLEEDKVFIDDSSVLRTSEIMSKCRKLKSEHGLDLIVIDYLQLLKGNRAENRQQEVSEISRNLKQLARELECPVIALSQLSRSIEQRGGEKRPLLSDLRESGSIEQDADLVIFLHSEDYYAKEKPQVRRIEVILAKHRNGELRNINLSFNTAVNCFYEEAKYMEGEYTDEK